MANSKINSPAQLLATAMNRVAVLVLRLPGKPDLSCGAGGVFVLVGIWVGAVADWWKGGIIKIVL